MATRKLAPAFEFKIPFLTQKVFVIALGFILLIYFLLLNPNLSSFVDNARYLVSAKSLLSGQGYSKIHEINVTIQTLYPPGYPIILAFLISIFSLNLIVLKIFSIFATFFSLIFIYLYLKEKTDFVTASAITLMAGISPLIVKFSATELTEAIYLAVSILAIYAVEKSTKTKKLDGYFLLAVLAATASYYIKSVGFVLLPAIVIYYVYKNENKKAVIFGFLFFLFAAPWLLRSFYVDSPANGTYLKQLMWKDYRVPGAGKATLIDIVERIIRNGYMYATFGFGKALALKNIVIRPVLDHIFSSIFGFLSVIVFIGFISKLRSKIWLSDVYIVLFFSMYLIWPTMHTRYMHPVMPFILLYFMYGIWFLGQKIGSYFSKSELSGRIVSIAGIAIIVTSLIVSTTLVSANLRRGGLPKETAHFYEAIDWVKNNSSKNSKIVSIKPEATFILSKRRAVSYLDRGYFKNRSNPENILRGSYDYLILDTFKNTTERIVVLNDYVNKHSNNFNLVYSTKQPAVKVYKIIK